MALEPRTRVRFSYMNQVVEGTVKGMSKKDLKQAKGADKSKVQITSKGAHKGTTVILPTRRFTVL